MRVFKAERSSSAEVAARKIDDLEAVLKVYEELLTERDQKSNEVISKNMELSSLAERQKTQIEEYKRRLIAKADELEEMRRRCVRAERDNGKLRKLAGKANNNKSKLSTGPTPDLAQH